MTEQDATETVATTAPDTTPGATKAAAEDDEEEEAGEAQDVAKEEPIEEKNEGETTATAAATATATATTTVSPSTFDFDHIQSLVCGVLEPFTSSAAAAAQEEDPPPPAGFVQEDGILTNGASKPGEPLIQYTTAGESVATLYQAFQFGAERRPNAACLGKRLTADSPYQWASYTSVLADAAKLGSYLKDIGVTPGQRVGLSGKNAPEYMTAIQGCFWAGATTVPIYDTFGEKECQYIIKQAEVQVVFVSKQNLDNILKWTKNIPSVKKIIVWGAYNNDDGDDGAPLPSKSGDLVVSYEECLRQEDPEAQPPNIATPPKPEDLAIIMYTSGTTGMPKGVMLTHSALLATIAAVEKYFISVGGGIESEDVFMSYLPLAHVFDFIVEFFFLFRGSRIGYYRGDQKTLVDDIGVLKPTIFIGVPRVFERIYKRVHSMVEGGSTIKKYLFQFFFNKKLAALKNGAKSEDASYLGDTLVFSKIKQRLGGRVRLIVSGGAPLPEHVEEWLKVTMCCPIVQGYGLTETCAASCLSLPDRNEQGGTVGPPLCCIEAKLDPVPEMGYDGTPLGGGEICFRGPSLMEGYYQKPEATAEVLKDGWFHTGDIGKFVHGGCIQIIDRKKQLFKLSQGEYVSPEKIEGICAKSSLVGHIWVYGNSTEAALVAVIVPSEDAFAKYGGKEAAINSEELQKEILEDLDRVCRSESLKGYEIPKGVTFHTDEWTPDTGFVTPTFKLKRPALKDHFSKEIDAMYATLNKD